MKKLIIALSSICLLLPSTAAHAFDVSFDWGDIPRCTSGNPNRVASPQFEVGGLPEGTTALRFKLADQNAPFDHGGGTVAYAGGDAIPSGAFRYMSPCPPSGKHTYVWTVTALDAAGKRLDTGKASKQYP